MILFFLFIPYRYNIVVFGGVDGYSRKVGLIVLDLMNLKFITVLRDYFILRALEIHLNCVSKSKISHSFETQG